MLLVVGEALIDLVPLPSGELGLPRWEARPGGSPFNVAMGCARLGVETAYAGRLSTDLNGELLRGRLVADGVDVRHVVRTDHPTELALVQTDADGVASYSFYFEGTASRSTTTADLPRALRPRAVHAGSIALVLDPLAAAVEDLLAGAHDHATISLDPNTRIQLVDDVEVYRRRLRDQVALAHVVKVSDEDLQAVAPGSADVDVARDWLTLGPNLVIVTRGPQGAVAVTDDEVVEVGGLDVDVADTVGAGDSFSSAMLAWLDEHDELEAVRERAPAAAGLADLLTFAARAAAVTCTRVGADPPRRSELATR